MLIFILSLVFKSKKLIKKYISFINEFAKINLNYYVKQNKTFDFTLWFYIGG